MPLLSESPREPGPRVLCPAGVGQHLREPVAHTAQGNDSPHSQNQEDTQIK